MQFNVASLLKEHTGAAREYDIDEDVRIDREPHRITGHARFDRTPDGVLVRARLRGEGRASCSRCLKEVTYPIEIVFEEEYIPTVDVDTGASVQVPEGEDEAYRINARHLLDLSEPIEQYWAMAEPMAPVCEEACRGLCPICGEEIRSEGHACTREQIDDRWAKLRNLKLG